MRIPIGAALAAALLYSAVQWCTGALAHNSWISRGGYNGKGQAAGEWCCGEGDCGVLVAGEVHATAEGYEVDAAFQIGSGAGAITERVREIVPYSEAQPSPDGAYWRCKRPNGSRRCFFAPPPST